MENPEDWKKGHILPPVKYGPFLWPFMTALNVLFKPNILKYQNNG
jgi:hypothetical protein